MKIAVLTLPLHNNYGGNLQAYALMESLKRLGYEPVFVRLAPVSKTLLTKVKIILKQLLKKYIRGDAGIKNSFLVETSTKDMHIISRASEEFIMKNIQPQTDIVFGRKGVREFDFSTFDAVVVGSDQVWRKEYAKEYLDTFFFDIPLSATAKRIAYAASFGTDVRQYSAKEIVHITSLLKRATSVSVRELSAVKDCSQIFGLNAMHVIDPTLLLLEEDYLKLLDSESDNTKNDGLFAYVLDVTIEKKEIINRISKMKHLSPFYVNAQSLNKFEEIEKRIYPPVSTWIKGFKDAQYVVTDSFHGCVFSIIFNKQFLVIGNAERGMERFNSLLKCFGLESRLISGVADCTDEKVFEMIDWQRIEEMLYVLRNNAKCFLSESLNSISVSVDKNRDKTAS